MLFLLLLIFQIQIRKNFDIEQYMQDVENERIVYQCLIQDKKSK